MNISRYLVAVLIGLLAMPPHVCAQRPLTPDPNAPAHMKPGLDAAPNGVPLVNIVKPSSSGLSHNLYQDFNVNRNGLVFNNNSGGAVQTQLGGMIMANPNLGKSPAKVILNEVTSTNRSHIEGYMEVGGRKADVILANPNGVTVNGGGYINVGAAAVTTGKPVVSGGALQGFDVSQGKVRVEGLGLDATQSDAFSILSRTAEIAADVYARELTVVTGQNEIRGARVTAKAGSPEESRPVVAVDSSLLGGMYANRIAIVATEKGVGVNLEGIAHSAGEMQLSADGKLTLRQAVAGGNASLSSNAGVKVKESAYAGGNLAVASKEVESGGVLAAGGNVDVIAEKIAFDGALMASGADASGNLGTSGDVRVRAGDLEAKNTKIFSGGTAELQGDKVSLNKVAVTANGASLAGGEVTAANSEVRAARVVVDAHNVKLSDTKIDALADMELRAALAELDNSRASAGGNLSARFDEVTLQRDSALASGGDMLLQGKKLRLEQAFAAAGRDLEYIGEDLQNAGGVLFAGQDQFLSVSGVLLNDSGEIYAGRDIVIAGLDGGRAGAVRNLSGTVSAGNDLVISADFVENTKRDFNVAVRGRHVGASEWTRCGSNVVPGYSCDRRKLKHYQNIYDDYVLTDSPAGRIFAASDIFVDAALLENKHSAIAAGGNLVVQAEDVKNTDTVLQRTTTLEIILQGWNSDGDRNEDERWSYGETFEKIGGVPVVFSANSDLYVDAAGTFSNLSNRQGISLPNDSAANTAYPFAGSPMFRPVSTPGRRYLIETNPLFTNPGIFFGSDYFTSHLGIDLNVMQARILGDAFYETRLIQEQIMAATGRRFLDGYGTDADQMRALMDSAAAQAQGLQLSVGVALSAEQIAALTGNILWMVEEEYMGQKVLVPRLYLASAAQDDIMPGGVQAKNVYVNAGQGILNQGNISGGNVNLSSLNVVNTGGMLRGGTLNVAALNDIFNNSGFMRGDTVNLLAGGDIVSQTLTQKDPGNSRNTSALPQAGIAAGNDLTAVAGNDLTIRGSNVYAGGEAALSAGRDLSVATVTSEFHLDHGKKLKVDKVTHTGSTIVAGGGLTMTAGRDLTVAGSRAAAGGEALLAAGNNLSVVSVRDTYSASSQTTSSNGGLLGGSSSSSFRRSSSANVSSDIVAGGELTLQAGGRTRGVTFADGNIAVVGSSLSAGDNLNLTATGNILALSGQNSSSRSSSSSSGNFLGGSARASGSSSLTQVASSLTGVNVTLDAGRNVTLQASNLGAANDAALVARGGDIQLLDAQNLSSSWSKSSQTGLGLGGGGDFLSFYGTQSRKQTSVNSNSAGSQVVTNNSAQISAGRDVVMVSGQVLAGNDLGVNAGRDVNILAGENTTWSSLEKKSQGVGLGALISLEKIDFFAGYQNKASGVTERASTAQSSVLASGNNINVSAGNNINVEAGKFTAGNDVNMGAGRDINLLQGENVQSVSEYKSQLRVGLNLTFEQNATSNAQKTYEAAAGTANAQNAREAGGGAVNTANNAYNTVNSSASASLTVGASGERSTKRETSVTSAPTEIFAGHDASLTAGRDVNMQGARLVTGNDATLAAGRDLNIYAGTSGFSSTESKSSFSAGAGIGVQASATGGASYGLTAKASLGLSGGETKTVTRNNAAITAGGKLSTISGRDTTASGANLLGDQVDMRVGRDLRVESVRDTAKSSSYNFSAGGQVTVGMGATSGNVSSGGSGNMGYSAGSGSSDLIGRQTTIIGANGVNIYTGDNTHIKGAV
ncbi:MAG: hemagglutinin repeat-containing protein, partial [Desulfovibrio sp.]|nr:hemagglutinin repeat-containing protein [Desulfovibrio sp.]